MTEILPGIHQFRLPLAGNRLRHINGYLLKGGDGYVLVDCGWDTDDVLEALRSELRDIGVGLGDVRALIVTHYHSDHYGLAGTLVRLAKLRLMMHRLDWLHVRTHLADVPSALRTSAAWLERHGLTREGARDEDRHVLDQLSRFTVVPPDVELEDAARIELGRHELRVVWTPGHTAGHICLYDAERRLLLSGDHVLDPITPNVSLAWPRTDNPLGDFLRSLRKVAELDVDRVLPAHGEPFSGLRRRVDELLRHHDHREALALEALAGGPATAAFVARQLPWTRREVRFDELPGFQQRMALTETIAHLEELRATGRVVATEDDGRIHYQLLAASERLAAGGAPGA